MDVSYHWHNLETSEALKDYTDKKLEKLTSHFNTLQTVTVRFRAEKLNHFVEFAINGDGVQFVGTENNPDLYAALDLLEKKMERQIRRHKEKNLGKTHRSND